MPPKLFRQERTPHRITPRTQKRMITWRIAFTHCLGGENGDTLTFMFRGTDMLTLTRVFTFLFGQGRGVFQKARLYWQRDVHLRNKFSSWRIVAEIMEYDSNMYSVDDIALLVESRLRAEGNCVVDNLSVNRFLNV